VTTLRFGLRAALAAAALVWLADPAFGQTTYTWNNSSTDLTSTGSWTPTGVPTTTDTAQFNVLGTFGASTINNPVLNVAAGAAQISTSNTATFQGWTLSGTGSLTTTSPTATNALITQGVGTTTINGPTLAGASATNSLSMFVGSGSTLLLQGNSAVTANQGNVTVAGILKLDNTATNVNARLLNTGTLTVNGGGRLELIGNAAGTTQNVGSLNVGNNVIGGVNSFVVTPNGALTKLVFANSATGFSTRPGTRGVYQFVATTGNLGDPNGGQITFAGTPFLGANGLLANTSGGGTVGYAIVTDAGGTDFATWNATSGIVRATPTQTGTTAANLQSYTANDRAQFNPTANQTASATITNGSLRIAPGTSGLTLDMGSNVLATNALMLDGPNNFTIAGTGTWTSGSSGTRYVYVNNPGATLSTSLVVAVQGNPTVFGGPGFVELTGSGSQNTLTTTNRFVIAGGTVRGNNTQIGFGSGGAGVISLVGGVLEIKDGTNGNGASADFTRPITNGASAAGSVTWGAQNAAEIGSGGFSAFGSTASVNINGTSTPDTLTWNQRNFVGDGYALKFGSTQSNATLRWLNPLNLDGGTPGNYLVREINVTKGAGNFADKTMMMGLISGSTSTDLLKTGTGVLELGATNNAIRGNTLIQGGTLQVTGDLGTTDSSARAGNVVVGRGAMLAGVGSVNPDDVTSKSVIVNPGGIIRGGNVASTTGSEHVGTLTVRSNLTINSTSTDRGTIQFEADRTGAGTANASKIALGDPFNLNLNPGSGNKFAIELVKTAATSSVNYNETYSVTLASVGPSGSIQLNGTTLADGTTIDQSNYVLTSSAFAFDPNYTLTVANGGQDLVLTFTPVPEPATVLGLAAAGLGLGAAVRRRLRRAAY
jgi:fibronectin-binding autotransporter adhesin